MTKTDLRDDASLAAMRLEWWPPSNWNGGRDAIGIGGRLRRNPQPTGRDDRVEVLYWSLWRERWTSAGPFGKTILPLDDALQFIASEDIFWAIRA